MLNKTIFFASSLILVSACNASSEKIEAKFSKGNEKFFNLLLAEDHTFQTASDYQSAKDKIWFEPISVKYDGSKISSIDTCSKLLAGEGIFSEAQPNQYVEFQSMRAKCSSLEILASSKSSKKSFLPEKLVSKDSHNILPKDFIPVISNSQVEEFNAMPDTTRWSAGVSVDRFEDTGIDAGILYQIEQNQVLRELGRSDFNNDGIEDALLYLRTKVNGGSYETNKIFVVTAGEDGLIKTLSVFPEDD